MPTSYGQSIQNYGQIVIKSKSDEFDPYSAKNVGHLTLFYFNIIQRLCHIRKQPIATWNKIVYIHDEQKNQWLFFKDKNFSFHDLKKWIIWIFGSHKRDHSI